MQQQRGRESRADTVDALSLFLSLLAFISCCERQLLPTSKHLFLFCCLNLLHHGRPSRKYVRGSYILEQWSVSISREQVSVSIPPPPIF